MPRAAHPLHPLADERRGAQLAAAAAHRRAGACRPAPGMQSASPLAAAVATVAAAVVRLLEGGPRA